jgi:hypothetical protein
MSPIAGDRLIVVFHRSPNRCDLDYSVCFEEVAIDQAVGAFTDLQFGPRPEEVLAGGVCNMGLGDGQDQGGLL